MLRRVPGILIATALVWAVFAGAATRSDAASLADLSVTTSNSVAGATTLGHSWTWTLHVANASGAGAAVFPDGSTILSDDLDLGNGNVSYDQPVLAHAFSVTGSIVCSITSGQLTCKANGTVSVWGGGSVDVSFTATPSSTGTFSSPRLFGTCAVDPALGGGVVPESIENNNGCGSDSVFVTAPDLQVSQTDNASGGVDQGGSWEWKLSVTNIGSAPAVFPAGAVVLRDELDASTGLAYGTPAVTTSPNVSGTIACSIDGSDTLTCTASGGPVSVGDTTGGFAISIPVTGSQTGFFNSPRTGGACRVDPGGVLVEPSTASNDCPSDQILVYHAVDLGVTESANPDPNVTGGANNGIDNLSHTIELINHGPVATSGARVLIDLANALPPSVQLDGINATAGSFDPGTGYWTVGNLNVDQSVKLTLTFSVGRSAPDNEKIMTSASVSPTEDYTIDRNSGNDNATFVTNVIGAETPQTITITPPSKDFGNERLNVASAPQSFTVTNNGAASLAISTASLTGPDATQYVISNDACTGATLQPGGQCTADVAFRPSTTGTITTAYFEVATVGTQAVPARTADVVVHGTGTTSDVSTSPSMKVFGSWAVGSTSPTQNFTITNSGGAALGNLAIAPAGTDAGQYVVTSNNCPATLPVSTSCTVGVAFAPTKSGDFNSATLDVASNDPAGTIHLPLFGTGIAPAVSAVPAGVDFGNRRVGTTSNPQTFTITNAGNNQLVISAVTLGGPDASQYGTANNGCVTTLQPGHSCTVDVTFNPGSAGTHSATLDVVSDDPAGATHLQLTGLGIQSVITPSTAKYDFGSQRLATTSATQRLTVANTGTDALSIGQVALSGADMSQFVMSNDTCSSAQILPAGRCTVDIAFKPTSLGPHTDASIDVPNDSGSGVSHVALSGTGTQPLLSTPVTTLDFGGQRVGTTSSPRSITITNSGAGALNISAVGLLGGDAGQYMLGSDYCSGRAVAAGLSCTVDVIFAPATSGAHGTTLTIRSDAPGSPEQVTLKGTGTVPAVAVAPSGRGFGTVTVGATSAPATFIVSNPGTSPLAISSTSLTGADAGYYLRQADHCSGVTLPPNGMCTVQVSFRPTSLAAHNGGALLVTSDAGTARALLSGRATAPSNAFSIAHVKTQKNGATRFDITVRAPGLISAITSAPRVAVFGQTRVRAGRAGIIHVTVNPGSGGRKLLRRRHVTLRVQLSVGFTPTFGTPRKLMVRGLLVKK